MARHRTCSLLIGFVVFLVAPRLRATALGGAGGADALPWTGMDAAERFEAEPFGPRLRSSVRTEAWLSLGARCVRVGATTAFEAFAELQIPFERVPLVSRDVRGSREIRDLASPILLGQDADAGAAPNQVFQHATGWRTLTSDKTSSHALPSGVSVPITDARTTNATPAGSRSFGPFGPEQTARVMAVATDLGPKIPRETTTSALVATQWPPPTDDVPRVPNPTAALADATAPQSAKPPSPSPPALNPELARACVRAAWRAAGLAGDGRLDSLAARARASAALPELRLRATRITDESGRLTYLDDPETPHYAASGSATYWLEARLAFRLDRLLFADEEVQIERLRIERTEARGRLTAKVMKALAEWQRALVLKEQPNGSAEQILTAELSEIEAIATLNVLTDGWFGRAHFRPRPQETPDSARPATSTEERE